MRIVIDARIINSSTGRYVERLLTHLQEIDRENEYVVLVPEKDKDYWKPKAKNFSIKFSNYDKYGFGEQLGFAWQLYRLKADLVHFCMFQQPILYFKRHVTTVHDISLLKTYNSDKNWLIFHLKQVAAKLVFFVAGHSSIHVITPSKFTKDEYVKFTKIPRNKVTVTYEASEITTSKTKPFETGFKNFLLYVGWQSDYKNIRRLVKAHQLLLKSNPNLGLVLVGLKNKPTQMTEKWVKKNQYKNINFTGFVSDEELAWLYKNCSAYVFPSLMEGFGLPGLEAMAHGAPVISSNATCLPEIYENAAAYFDPTSEKEMAEVIEKVLGDSKLRQELIKKGFSQVKKYSWDRMAKQTHDVYLKALRSK